MPRVKQEKMRLVEILKEQSQEAFRLKPKVGGIREEPPFGDESPDAGEGAIPKKPGPKSPPVGKVTPSYQTGLGKMYTGDSLDILPALADEGVRVKLIMTSPPFALVRKKAYGNEDADSYVEWLTISLLHQYRRQPQCPFRCSRL